VKWLLVIPHLVVLSFLWVAFVIVSIAAFISILATGKYPPSLFDFNVGVLRWSWRVGYYAYGALGTDHYPPFTLREVDDYPTHLTIDYPQHLSRGLVLVKWWLLAIPHYVVVAIFTGEGTRAAWEGSSSGTGWSGGLIGFMTLIAGFSLVVTGRYPTQLFNFVLGMNRWVLRVVAYAALMTDQYPPFRLDMGGVEPDTVSPVPLLTETVSGRTQNPDSASLNALASAREARASSTLARQDWSASRVAALVAGATLAIISVGLLASGGAVAWMDATQRDSTGYLTSDTHLFATSTYAITSDHIDLGTSEVLVPSSIIGTVKIEVTSQNPANSIFVGIAPRSAVDQYLDGAGRKVLINWGGDSTYSRPKVKPTLPISPTNSSIWVASSYGTATQVLTWEPTGGDWTIVVMNTDGTPGLAINAAAGATFPALNWIALGLFILGGMVLTIGGLLVVVAVSQRPEAATSRGEEQSA
jgi:hypothetical protein